VNNLLVRPSQYRLGAEELLELGKAEQAPAYRYAHTPFLANRPTMGRRIESEIRLAAPENLFMGAEFHPMMGDIFSDVGGFITGALGFALNTLGDLVNVPLNLISQGLDIAFTGLAGLLDSVPIIGSFLGQILLLGNAIIKFALSVPGLLLHGMGGILTNISKALTAKNTPAQNQGNVDKGKSDIISQAPSGLAGTVKSILDSTGVTGHNLTPALQPGAAGSGNLAALPPGAPSGAGSDLVKALTIGIPVAGAAAVLFMFAK
jgi:hypothetical protein